MIGGLHKTYKQAHHLKSEQDIDLPPSRNCVTERQPESGLF